MRTAWLSNVKDSGEGGASSAWAHISQGNQRSRADGSCIQLRLRYSLRHKLLREELRYIVAQRAYMPEDLRLNCKARTL